MKNILSLIIISFLMLGAIGSLQANFADKEIMPKDEVIINILHKAEVYPNPADDHIFLKIKENESSSEIKIEVMSIIGTKMNITHDKAESGLYKIDLVDVPTGHYYVLLTVGSEKSLKKFLKK